MPNVHDNAAELAAALAQLSADDPPEPAYDPGDEVPLTASPLSVPCTIATHETLKANPASWIALPYVGVMHVEADEHGPAMRVVLRNCTACCSTLARDEAVAA